MAFAARIGSLLKQSISQNIIASNGHGSLPSMYNSLRCMSGGSNLFVGSLSYSTDDYSLKEAFSTFGEVLEAKVITDRENGKSRGFGFVNYSSEESASAAITGMDGKELAGRIIHVSYANQRPPRGGGGYGGGGGSW
ncbi:glycine-rich RNA-binding protein 2, mitochondrial-like [Papaver somniferum]|uniref:glycine-rich RNA-binding protein 2, mitochondrial-like n=1 Tax=Papaver somniferum TaxID=3469 RepID=UPI000E6FDD9B|nr:glycine-rich RNA-binding protein 2, mitochondrial-like [Papaver somniferum]